MVLGLLMGCNNGVAELEKKSTFYESVLKIGQGFQEIFGVFGNAMGETLGIVKSGDNKSEVGKHFSKVGEGLKKTKDKLDGLMREITSAPNADTKGVESVISSASGVIGKLIESVTKLSEVTAKGGATPIGDTVNNASEPAEEASVKTIIEGVKNIIDAAEKSGVEIKSGDPGSSVVANANGTKALIHNSAADANIGPKLGDEVSKADPWAMIDKIKDAKTGTVLNTSNYDAGELAVGAAIATAAGAKTTADLAAAVALKAMTKGGKLSANVNEVVGVKAAGLSAVNKVLGVLDEIIRRTVAKNLEKVREAVKGIQYSETNGEATEVKK